MDCLLVDEGYEGEQDEPAVNEETVVVDDEVLDYYQHHQC
jgi:hypothetical protein